MSNREGIVRVKTPGGWKYVPFQVGMSVKAVLNSIPNIGDLTRYHVSVQKAGGHREDLAINSLAFAAINEGDEVYLQAQVSGGIN